MGLGCLAWDAALRDGASITHAAGVCLCWLHQQSQPHTETTRLWLQTALEDGATAVWFSLSLHHWLVVYATAAARSGAGDDASNVGVMLELASNLVASPLESLPAGPVMFLFSGAEEPLCQVGRLQHSLC